MWRACVWKISVLLTAVEGRCAPTFYGTPKSKASKSWHSSFQFHVLVYAGQNSHISKLLKQLTVHNPQRKQTDQPKPINWRPIAHVSLFEFGQSLPIGRCPLNQTELDWTESWMAKRDRFEQQIKLKWVSWIAIKGSTKSLKHSIYTIVCKIVHKICKWRRIG